MKIETFHGQLASGRLRVGAKSKSARSFQSDQFLAPIRISALEDTQSVYENPSVMQDNI